MNVPASTLRADSADAQASALPRLDEAVSVLMPVCDEIDVIDLVIKEWVDDVFAHLPSGSELVFDDCSTDGTTQAIRAWMETHPFIRLNTAPRDGFFKSAMRLYELAECDLVFFTDSDGQYVPKDFWKVAAHIGDHDMVHGAKVNRHDPKYRVTSSGVFNVLIRRLFGSNALDANSAFRLIRRELLEQVTPHIRHLGLLPNAEMYIRAENMGFRIKNVPVEHRPRLHGPSKSLPRGVFAAECWRAFQGLRRLRAEMAGPHALKRSR